MANASASDASYAGEYIRALLSGSPMGRLLRYGGSTAN